MLQLVIPCFLMLMAHNRVDSNHMDLIIKYSCTGSNWVVLRDRNGGYDSDDRKHRPHS